MSYSYIDSDSSFEQLRSQISASSTLFLDTEFIRVSTYFPKLGLLQLHIDDVDYLIDPLGIKQKKLLWDSLYSDEKLFVFHSCKEDLDVLLVSADRLPNKLFDTQVAAAFIGYGPSLGYASLVEKICGISVDKDQTLTDWLARPLSERQKVYAARDVTYLPVLFEHLNDELGRQGKADWFNEEMLTILGSKQQEVILDELYLEISGAWQLYPSELAVLQHLAQWRYLTAIREDKPQNFVLREEVLLELSRKRPQTERELAQSDIPSQQRNRYASSVLQCIQDGMGCPPENQPARIKRMIDFPHYKHDFKQIKNKVEIIARDYNLPIELLGSRKLINQYLLWVYEGKRGDGELPKLISGWRKALLNL